MLSVHPTTNVPMQSEPPQNTQTEDESSTGRNLRCADCNRTYLNELIETVDAVYDDGAGVMSTGLSVPGDIRSSVLQPSGVEYIVSTIHTRIHDGENLCQTTRTRRIAQAERYLTAIQQATSSGFRERLQCR